jgi:hypothetical protein
LTLHLKDQEEELKKNNNLLLLPRATERHNMQVRWNSIVRFGLQKKKKNRTQDGKDFTEIYLKTS